MDGDADLVVAVRAGDQAAFAAVDDCYEGNQSTGSRSFGVAPGESC